MAYRSNFTGAQIDAAIEKAHKSGSADPTINTVGVLGQRYFNTTTGSTFECTATITVDEVTTYTWRNVITNSLTETVAGKALDATKGKALNDLISTLSTNFNNYSTEVTHYTSFASRDISTAGTQQITGIPFTAKKINFRVCIDGTKIRSDGVATGTDSSKQNCYFTNGSTGNMSLTGTTHCIYLTNGTWTIVGRITEITSSSFTITWAISAGTPSGTAYVIFDVDKH